MSDRDEPTDSARETDALAVAQCEQTIRILTHFWRTHGQAEKFDQALQRARVACKDPRDPRPVRDLPGVTDPNAPKPALNPGAAWPFPDSPP